jgi:phosphoribosylanthranilate isomerase
MIVQIYEIQTPYEAEKCIEAGVDHIGSVILRKSEWRVPALKDTIWLSQGTSVKNSVISLFQDSDTLYRALDYYRPHYVHFCESLTDGDGQEEDLTELFNYQSDLKKKFPEIGIIRSIPVPENGGPSDFPSVKIANFFESITDIFLIDTWIENEPVTGFIGITGKTADREIARDLVIQSKTPVILGGGLSPENVYEALMEMLPAGADSCTGTNMKDKAGKPIRFKKDFAEVACFVKETRRVEEKVRQEQDALREELEDLKSELNERELALPPHSVRPHQLLAIEALEDEIVQKENEINRFEKILSNS